MTNTNQQPMILIVDDVPANVQILAIALSSSYRIKVANNGLDALTIAQNEQPDLILLDIMMPNMDGFEVCRRLKENTLTDKIAVIFVTADNASSDEELGLSLGAVDYITKPFVIPIVKARIRNQIRLKKKVDLLELKPIDIFPWNTQFNTGIPNIDEQHQVLVQLLNRLASHAAFHSDIQTLNIVFNQLADYADYHFQTEEAIWHEYFQNDALEIKHKVEHNNFISTVINLKNKQDTNSLHSRIDKVLLFLVNWLANHILENDKYMALVVLAMQSGMSPEQAKKQANDELHDGRKQLINVILSAYTGLAANTTQLMKEAIERKQVEQRLNTSATKLKLTVQRLEMVNEDLKKQFTDFIKVFAQVIEMRPGIKSEESKYIIEKAMLIARNLGMNTEDSKNILYAGLLMKIGKMGLSDDLLEKSFYTIPLADKQRYLRHAVEGGNILSGVTQLKGASVLIRHQYERFDGSGLPDGLAKQNIPLGARILSVVSDYIQYLNGSMTGEEMPINLAISQLIDRKGSYYDPDIVDALVELVKDTTVEGMEIDLPVVKKSWKSGSLRNKDKAKNFMELRPVVEIPWPQLEIGMDIESVYFGDKSYIRNCIADKRIISEILSLSERIGKDPIIRVRLGKK